MSESVQSCPQCSSSSLRESRWASRAEKQANAGLRPLRCEACGHRYLSSLPRQRAAWSGAWWGLLLLLLLLLGGGLWAWWGESTPASHPVKVGAVEPSALLQAAREGDVEAQFRLARSLLLDPMRSRQEADDALGWLRQAANAGHLEAMVELGKLYRSGIGVTQNYSMARQWIEQAALAGEPEGMLELGRLYRGGIGVEVDLVQAYVWFNRAAAAHHGEGAHERDNVALKLNPAELERAQAASLDVAEARP